ncbi:MAG: hypothetical protein ACREFY_09920 [Acetobacteraceae bacterium]
MNARQVTTTLGALALGLATIGIGPAMAQMGGPNSNGAAMHSGAEGMTGGSGQGMGNAAGMVNGQQGGTMGRAAGAAADQYTSPKPGMSSGGMGEHEGMPHSGNAEGAMGYQHSGHAGHHDRMHAGQYRMGHHHGGERGMAAGGGDAQNPEVDRLNQQSLEAARKNEAFNPSSQQ